MCVVDLHVSPLHRFIINKLADGLVLFWSLKHPEYPHKVYHTECSVTSLAFANKSANLLAVGLYDGTVGVYDVRKPEVCISLGTRMQPVAQGRIH